MEIVSKNDSIITTSQDFVLIKYGIEIKSAMKLSTTPQKTFTWRIKK
tara:strand:+ start:251 stop:391 length:141 start_codon:yes stop_codon:yes gene_type:complete